MFTLDAYAARSCPLKTYNTFTAPRPESSIIPRFPGSVGFDRRILAVLNGTDSVVDLRPDRLSGAARTVGSVPPTGAEAAASTVASGSDDDFSQFVSHEEQERLALQAMDAETDLIIGALLPRDWAGHRSGRVPLLVRDKAGEGYFPAVIKYQRVSEHREDGHYEYSTLSDPTEVQTLDGHRFRWHWRAGTALQLAHYWRLLEAIGRAATSKVMGGVIGTDELIGDLPVISWIDLEESNLAIGTERLASPLELYADEFTRRITIAERAIAEDPELPGQLVPVITHECELCIWRERCVSRLDPDDLSVRISKTPLDVAEVLVLREAGISTTEQLAAADLEALLPHYLAQVDRAGAEERLRLAQRRSVLMSEGIEVERTTTGPIEVPAAGLEIDIDLETSSDDRVYLWGFWVHDTATDQRYYQPFVSFEHLDDDAELTLAREAMIWLREQVEVTEALVYHYSDYETVRIARLAGMHKDPALAWARNYAKTNFVDLFKIVRANFFGTHGLGLKTVASNGAGFHWRDEDPGGLNSMRWFEDAVSGATPDIREHARTRVLEYNEDDVRATWQLRHWLRSL